MITDRMPEKPPDDPLTQEQQEAVVRALFARAQQQGTPDAWIGKRRWTRYRIGMPLEITLNPSVSGGSWRVITHNVSRGGLGFWSKQALSSGETIYVREWAEANPGCWLMAQATYSVLGINGYLVGVSFKYPDKPDAPFDVRQYDRADQAVKRRRRARFSTSRLSLRRHGALAAAGGSALAWALTNWAQPYLEILPGQGWRSRWPPCWPAPFVGYSWDANRGP